jgi:hypothetical protein
MANLTGNDTKFVWTGLESSGKSLQLSIQAERVLKRNIRWYKITGIPRTMAFDTPMSPSFIKEIEEAGLTYLKFSNLKDILYLEECDIFINEIIKYFPASGSNSLTQEQLDFITQGAKSGVYLFMASQDFSQCHIQLRRLVNKVFIVQKLIGSRRPMKSAPPVKRIWGICMEREVRPQSFKGETADMESVDLLPSLFFIMRDDCERFDTSYKVPLTELPPKYVRRQEIIGKDPQSGDVVYHKEVWK